MTRETEKSRALLDEWVTEYSRVTAALDQAVREIRSVEMGGRTDDHASEHGNPGPDGTH